MFGRLRAFLGNGLGPLSALICVALCCAPQAQAADRSGAAAYAIPAGDLDAALKQLLTVSTLDILYSPAMVAQRRSPGAKGGATAREALGQLLSGTGLTAVEVAPSSYVLRVKDVSASPSVPRRAEGAADTPTELSAVQVTGTRIARNALQTSSPLSVITQEDIRASGQVSLFELLKAWPGMYGLHPRDVSVDNSSPFQIQIPMSKAAGASLYGFGPRATLFLVDGVRTPYLGAISPKFGSFVDLNGIPLSFIDRIEIMSGGTSAIYGADAIAGVVNIILKRGYVGGTLTATSGISDRGDAFERGMSASYGKTLANGGELFIAVDWARQDGLTGSDRAWAASKKAGPFDTRKRVGIVDPHYGIVRPYCPGADERSRDGCLLDLGLYTHLVPETDRGGLRAFFSAPLGAGELYADLFVSKARTRMQYAPVHGGIGLSSQQSGEKILDLNYVFFDVGPIRANADTLNIGAKVGIAGEWRDWKWDLMGYRRSNRTRDRQFNLIDEKALLSALDQGRYRLLRNADNSREAVDSIIAHDAAIRGRSVLQGAALTVSGEAFQLPGGPASVAAGVEVRQEAFEFDPGGAFRRGAVLGYYQNTLPRDDERTVLSQFAEFNLPITQDFSVDAAWRIDREKRLKTHISPKLGFKWSLTDHLAIRGSYGEGYRVPTAFEYIELPVGSGPQLVPRELYAGPCEVAPQSIMPACLVRVTSVRNSDLRPEVSRNALYGLLWAPSGSLDISLDRYRFVRSNQLSVPSPREVLKDPSALGLDADGKLREMRFQIVNAGDGQASGWQFEGNYRRRSPTGQWAMQIAGNYVERLSSAEVFNAAGIEVSRLRLESNLRYSREDWSGNVRLHYRSGRRPLWRAFDHGPFPDGAPRIPSMTTLDMGLEYRGFDKWSLGLSVRNIADRSPVNRDGSLSGYSVSDDDTVGRYYAFSAAYGF